MASGEKNSPTPKRKDQDKRETIRGDDADLPATKKIKLSPSGTIASVNGQNSRQPKPITAASISSLPKAKRAPSERPSHVPKQRRSPAQRDPSPTGQSRTPSRSPPRQRKRPGAGAKIRPSDAETVRKRQLEREQAHNQEAQLKAHASTDIVRSAYNAVPQRGREWRQKDSQIKGLRSFNNWVKSALIQKFSPTEDTTPGSRMGGHHVDGPGLRVLDIGCGKGGDLQKWQNAPCQVDLYVGVDPADVSIQQAKDRYAGMPALAKSGEFRGRPLYKAHFFARDCFKDFLGDIAVIRQVGIDPNPGQGLSMPGHGGGFDVVSMMFSLHYAWENEQRTRAALRNISGALKKGGRFLGVLPNSNVIQAKLREIQKKRMFEAEGHRSPLPKKEDGEIDENDPNDIDNDIWDPEKIVDVLPSSSNSTDDEHGSRLRYSDNFRQSASDYHSTPDLSPRPGGDAHLASRRSPLSNVSSNTPNPPQSEEIIWGNTLYKVSFPKPPPPPHALFRPLPFGWKYFFYLEEAVDLVPEYVVPWEAFRAMAADFDLELLYCKTFEQVWLENKDDRTLGALSERMGVRSRAASASSGKGGELLVGQEELEAANFYLAFCFYKA